VEYFAMRLYEFEQISPIRQAARDYAAKGFKIVARGASALVLSDGATVIKIGPTKDCWLAFAKNAKGSGNKHLPQIEDIEIMGNHYLAKIERLYDVPENFFKSPLYQKIAAWLVVNANWKTPRDVYLGKYSPGQITKLANMLDVEEPEIAEALELIKSSKGGCNFDLHPDNIMKRKNGTLVMNDPLTTQG
jgi:hypothetical protein